MDSHPTREGRGFPSTHWSVIRSAADPDLPGRRASLDELGRLYWKPVYAYFRGKWGRSREQAMDLTQDLFVALMEKDFLQNLSPEHGRFRAYLRAALDNFARYQFRHDSRKKRGGGILKISLESLEGWEPTSEGGGEDVFDQSWRQCVLEDALGELEREFRASGMAVAWEVFYLRDVHSAPEDTKPSYESLAKRFSVKVTDVTNFLFRARKRLREMTLERVRETVDGEESAQEEMKELFGKGP